MARRAEAKVPGGTAVGYGACPRTSPNASPRLGSAASHFLAWRDLEDVEAGGSEVHAHEVANHDGLPPAST